MRIRPLAILAVCLLAAAVIEPWLQVRDLLILSLVLFGCGCHPRRQIRLALWISAASVFWVTVRTLPGPQDLQRHLPYEAQSARLRFVVAGDAVARALDSTRSEWRVPVRVTASWRAGEWSAVSGRVQLRMPEAEVGEWIPGTVWEARGVLTPREEAYVGLHRAQWRLVPDPDSTRPLALSPHRQGTFRFFQVRAWFSDRLGAGAEGADPRTDLLRALLLGQRGEVESETLVRFARTGMVHIFAVSGLHLGILAGIAFQTLKWAGLSLRHRALVLIPLLIGFSLCTGFRASALRACIMICGCALAPLFYRKASLPRAFALAVILIVGYAPAQVRDVGFQFSFLLVAGLLLCANVWTARILELTAGDPWAPRSNWRSLSERMKKNSSGALVVNVLCFLLSAPLTAFHFNLWSPVGLIGNLLAVPLLFFLLATGFPALLLAWLPEIVVSVLLFPSRFIAGLLLSWVSAMEQLPGSYRWVQAPPLWLVCLFYAACAAAWGLPRFRGLAVKFLLVLCGFILTRGYVDSRTIRLGISPAGQGQMAWLETGDGKSLLVDTGSRWTAWRHARDLQTHGVNDVQLAFFTHPHRNYVEGASRIFQSHFPEQIGVFSLDSDHDMFSDWEKNLLQLDAGDHVELNGWHIEVLHPPKDFSARRMGDRSLVLRMSKGTNSVLFMGGAGERVERRIVEQGLSPAARILVAGNPSTGELVHAEFLEAVNPEVVVFSGRSFQGIREARGAAEARVLASGRTVLRLGESDAFTLTMRSK